MTLFCQTWKTSWARRPQSTHPCHRNCGQDDR